MRRHHLLMLYIPLSGKGIWRSLQLEAWSVHAAAIMHAAFSIPVCEQSYMGNDANDESSTVAEVLPLRLKHNPKTLILKHPPPYP